MKYGDDKIRLYKESYHHGTLQESWAVPSFVNLYLAWFTPPDLGHIVTSGHKEYASLCQAGNREGTEKGCLPGLNKFKK
jgi:hypothetical protein